MNSNIKLDINKKYIVSRSVNISITQDGNYVINNSLSRPLKEVDFDHLMVLNAFLTPTTFHEAHKTLSAFYEISIQDLKTVLTQLLNLNILTIEQKTPAKIASAMHGFASLVSQHNMVKDTVRVFSYKTAITNQVKNKRVIDLGCGTGILSIFAAKAGASSVVAIEESYIASLAQEMFKSNKIDHLVKLYNSNSKDVVIDKKADVLIHEIIGMDPLDENILIYIEDAKKRFLNKNGIMIPSRMEICCIAYEDELRGKIESEAALLGDLYGVDFSSYVSKVKLTNEIEIDRNNEKIKNQNLFGKKIISNEVLLYDLNFSDDNLYKALKKKKVSFKMNQDGTISGVLIYFKAHLSKEIILSTSPFAPNTHWGQKNKLFANFRQAKKNSIVNLEFEIVNIEGQQLIQLKLL